MKRFIESVKESNVLMFLLLLLCVVFGVTDASAMCAAGGAVPSEGPASIEQARVEAPDLDQSDVEKLVTELEPSRHALFSIVQDGRRSHSDSFEYKWYLSDYMPVLDKLTANATIVTTAGTTSMLTVANRPYFEIHQVLFPKSSSIVNLKGEVLALLVVGISSAGVEVIPLNGDPGQTYSIPNNTGLILSGTAKSEIDWGTDSKVTYPFPETNYVQMFMAEVSETEYQKLNLKEVKWGMSDYVRTALDRFKTSMELTFLLGSKSEVVDPIANNQKRTSRGLLNFGIQHKAAPTTWDEAHLIEMCSYIFDDNNGSDERYLLADKVFLNGILGLKFVQRMQNANSSNSRLNINWQTLSIGGNTLHIKRYNLLDRMGTQNAAIFIDPANIGKAIQIPMQEHHEGLNVNRTRGKNIETVVIRETSCLTVYNPETHGVIGNIFV
jgi:hypothetical protein